MPRPRKPLSELVDDGSFLARRHADRLLEPPLACADLALLQASYARESNGDIRKEIARDFERAVRSDAKRKRQLTDEQPLLAAYLFTGRRFENVGEARAVFALVDAELAQLIRQQRELEFAPR